MSFCKNRPLVRMNATGAVTVDPVTNVAEMVQAAANLCFVKRAYPESDRMLDLSHAAIRLNGIVSDYRSDDYAINRSDDYAINRSDVVSAFGDLLLSVMSVGLLAGINSEEEILNAVKDALGRAATIELTKAMKDMLRERGMTVESAAMQVSM